MSVLFFFVAFTVVAVASLYYMKNKKEEQEARQAKLDADAKELEDLTESLIENSELKTVIDEILNEEPHVHSKNCSHAAKKPATKKTSKKGTKNAKRSTNRKRK